MNLNVIIRAGNEVRAGRCRVLSSRALHFKGAICLDVLPIVPINDVCNNKCTIMHYKNFMLMYIGHSSGLFLHLRTICLVLNWRVCLVLEKPFPPLAVTNNDLRGTEDG
jgi:hypothetical protein